MASALASTDRADLSIALNSLADAIHAARDECSPRVRVAFYTVLRDLDSASAAMTLEVNSLRDTLHKYKYKPNKSPTYFNVSVMANEEVFKLASVSSSPQATLDKESHDVSTDSHSKDSSTQQQDIEINKLKKDLHALKSESQATISKLHEQLDKHKQQSRTFREASRQELKIMADQYIKLALDVKDQERAASTSRKCLKQEQKKVQESEQKLQELRRNLRNGKDAEEQKKSVTAEPQKKTQLSVEGQIASRKRPKLDQNIDSDTPHVLLTTVACPLNAIKMLRGGVWSSYISLEPHCFNFLYPKESLRRMERLRYFYRFSALNQWFCFSKIVTDYWSETTATMCEDDKCSFHKRFCTFSMVKEEEGQRFLDFSL
ncbi:hypothetical protein S40285_10117 [Stachybotrys chlorohalonatus IBT 40285]|uniref:Uncharacterized protein n=1 Tax=Stachybotrys chlorohalonatus (strain IBT 40285) TaxID=1283841 RepID=A0A084QVM7_STAC4|nr:hypothetical protein S40285_10117 [Stachybotrys chlorohalonata IBT 40285]